jgi:bla regulator protein BlaR1
MKPVSDPAPLEALESCCREVGLKRPVRLVSDDRVPAPAVVGFWRPTIVVPSGLLDRLGASDWRSIFLHELRHVRRGDSLVNPLVALAMGVHWFNPVA